MEKPNICQECGTPIRAEYQLCYNCHTTKTAQYINHCITCQKPIDSKYAKCYRCNNTAIQPVTAQ